MRNDDSTICIKFVLSTGTTTVHQAPYSFVLYERVLYFILESRKYLKGQTENLLKIFRLEGIFNGVNHSIQE